MHSYQQRASSCWSTCSPTCDTVHVWILAIITDVQLYLILMGNSLTMHDVQYCFMCLLALWISYLVRWLFTFLTLFSPVLWEHDELNGVQYEWFDTYIFKTFTTIGLINTSFTSTNYHFVVFAVMVRTLKL